MYVCLVGYANYVKRVIQKARICIKICAVYSYLRLDIVNFIYFVIRLLYIYISLSGKLIYRFIFHSNRKTRETNELIRLTLINFDYYEQSCESNFLLSFRSKICKNVSLSFFFFFFNFTVCLKYRLQIMYNIP